MLVDLHLHLNSLIEYFNDQRAFRDIGLDPFKIFEAARDILVNTGQDPFLTKSESENPYYQKYVKLWSENDKELVPEFYFHGGDIYDLLVSEQIKKNEVAEIYFSIFFVIKIDELRKFNPEYLDDYFNFQLYDNFYGDLEYYIKYLDELPAIAPNFRQLPEIVNDWVKKNPQKESKTKNIVTEWSDFLSKKVNYKIPGKLTDEEIKKFFTFFSDEVKNEGSYLKKEEVAILMQNGLTIPPSPLEKKFKLSFNNKRYKKTVDYSIHKLYKSNTLTFQDKSDYILFFAHFIEDYAPALNSRHELQLIQSNISGKEPKRYPVKWDNYLPV